MEWLDGPGLLLTLIALVIGITLIPYIFGPILVKFVFSANANPVIQAYDPYKNPPPMDVCDFFNFVDAELKKVGFVATSHMIGRELVAGVDSYLMYVQNEQTQIEAIAIAACAKTQDLTGGRMQSKAIEFSTVFVDGQMLDTTNTQEELSLYRPPGKHMRQFQFVTDPVKLYHVHMKSLEELGNLPRKPLTPPERQPQRLAESMQEEFAAQLPVGIMKLDSTGTKYVPTLIGAYKLVLPNLFPFKQIARARRKKRCDAMLRRWGL